MASAKKAAGSTLEETPEAKEPAAEAQKAPAPKEPEVAIASQAARPAAEIKQPEAPAPTPKPAPDGKATYRVWEFGSLRYNGDLHPAGAKLELPTSIGDGIVCLTKL